MVIYVITEWYILKMFNRQTIKHNEKLLNETYWNILGLHFITYSWFILIWNKKHLLPVSCHMQKKNIFFRFQFTRKAWCDWLDILRIRFNFWSQKTIDTNRIVSLFSLQSIFKILEVCFLYCSWRYGKINCFKVQAPVLYSVWRYDSMTVLSVMSPRYLLRYYL